MTLHGKMSCSYAECVLLGMLALAVGFAVGSAQSPTLDLALAAFVRYTKQVDALYNQGKLNGDTEKEDAKTGAMTLLGMQGVYIAQDPKDRDPVVFKKQVDNTLTTLPAQLDQAVTPVVTDPNATGSWAHGSGCMQDMSWDIRGGRAEGARLNPSPPFDCCFHHQHPDIV